MTSTPLIIVDFPRHLKLFDPSYGGFARFVDVGEALQVANGVPIGGEALEVRWLQPKSAADALNGVQDTLVSHKFYNKFDIFLENNGSTAPISQIPDEQLLASLSMASILEGLHPGTDNFLTKLGEEQENMWFETILLDCKLKSKALVITGNPMTEGMYYDLEFMKTGQSTNTKMVRADIVDICQYGTRKSDYSFSVYCVPGAVTRPTNIGGFGKLKTSDLGAANSQIRQDICNMIQGCNFYA